MNEAPSSVIDQAWCGNVRGFSAAVSPQLDISGTSPVGLAFEHMQPQSILAAGAGRAFGELNSSANSVTECPCVRFIMFSGHLSFPCARPWLIVP